MPMQFFPAAFIAPVYLAASPGDSGAALEFRPSDTEIFEAGRKGLRAVKYRISAHSKALSRQHAQDLAVKAWEASGSALFGPDFSNWALAQGKIMTCDPPSEAGITCCVSVVLNL